jgi:hypothetical protein
MNSISIQKACEKCERSSRYLLKKLGKEDFYICSYCNRKLCKKEDIMEYAFPKEEKPISGIAREHLRDKKKKKPNRYD